MYSDFFYTTLFQIVDDEHPQLAETPQQAETANKTVADSSKPSLFDRLLSALDMLFPATSTEGPRLDWEEYNPPYTAYYHGNYHARYGRKYW